MAAYEYETPLLLVQLGTIEAIEGQREDESIHFVLRLAQTEVVAIVGFTCIARAQKPVHASGSTVDRLFRATVNIGGRRACVSAVRLSPKLSQYVPHSLVKSCEAVSYNLPTG